MFRKHSRIIAAVVLSFFTWTSGGVFSVAHAAQDEVKKTNAQAPAKQSEGAEERFARLTETLTANLQNRKTTPACAIRFNWTANPVLTGQSIRKRLDTESGFNWTVFSLFSSCRSVDGEVSSSPVL
jgi:hypothetical protein